MSNTPSWHTEGMEELFAGYSEQWDSYYDTRTGEWLERVCDDEECRYCIGRPAKFELPPKP